MPRKVSSDSSRKKQFQPTIPSYLQHHDGSTTSSPSSPPIPQQTQASLLSVGMRVRKSVPEGYKTHKTVMHDDISSAASQNGELSTLCGLHKTGDFEQHSSAGYELPRLTSTQSTISSQDSYSQHSKLKRSLEEEIEQETQDMEEQMDIIFDKMDREDAELVHRAIAQPRRRVARTVTEPEDMDFEDAVFLCSEDQMVLNPD